MTAISTSGLTKRFRGGQLAVDHIDLAVPSGSVYGFLGPNGSGKTTTIRMLLGLAFPSDGSAALLGVSMPDGATQVLHRVGSLVEGPAFYPFLTGLDNLARYDAADRSADPRTARTRIDGALDRVGLMPAAKKRYRHYSLGMKQRLAIAAGLLQPRELIILDEPTNGLDPQGTREVRDADQADRRRRHHRVRVLAPARRGGADLHARRGDAVRAAGLPGLAARTAPDRSRPGSRSRPPTRRKRSRCWPAWARRPEDHRGRAGPAHAEPAGRAEAPPAPRHREVSAVLGEAVPERVCAELVQAGVGVRGFAVTSPSLEDLFVGLTGEGFDVSA